MDFEQARNFIYRNARPLDIARWKYIFEKGSREDVLTALSAYQNADGGFGNALESDCWNPNSSPVQTWAATQILKEIGFEDGDHPLVRGILRYLSSGKDFDGHVWKNTVPSNDEYPHAPWWNYDPDAVSYNPTASLAGFILKFSDKRSAIYRTACRVTEEAYADFQKRFPSDSMHTVACYAELYEYGAECGFLPFDKEEFKALLREQIRRLLSCDAAKWGKEYACKPSLFIRSKTSAFYRENKKLCESERQFISDGQREDGAWEIPWAWGAYPEAWNVAKNWWKSDVIIKNLRFIKEMREE